MGARNVTRGTVLAENFEVASSLWARFMGLMGRPPLERGAGLWLTGTNGIHMWFMRFPIDAVFLGKPDASGQRIVLATRSSLRPWTGLVPLIRGADGCLELPAGTVSATRTGKGDHVRLD
ncbi:MAG: DUF192 domain-containing protein [Dehalococcoidia bacterium]